MRLLVMHTNNLLACGLSTPNQNWLHAHQLHNAQQTLLLLLLHAATVDKQIDTHPIHCTKHTWSTCACYHAASPSAQSSVSSVQRRWQQLHFQATADMQTAQHTGKGTGTDCKRKPIMFTSSALSQESDRPAGHQQHTVSVPCNAPWLLIIREQSMEWYLNNMDQRPNKQPHLSHDPASPLILST
jgi:hypothetical protein